MAMQIEVGHSIYLVRSAGGAKSQLMVWTHGDRPFFATKIRRPAGCTYNVHFYAPDGRTLHAKPINLITGRATPCEALTIAAGKIPDHVLSKSQGWHRSENDFTGFATLDTLINWLRNPQEINKSLSYEERETDAKWGAGLS
jgi:hypothetical protein